MRFFHEGHLRSGIVQGGGVLEIEGDLLSIIQSGTLPKIPDGEAIPLAEVTPHLPYDVPPKIWCIGLNYKSHAEDINAVQRRRSRRVSAKPASCMFWPGGEIVLPPKEVSNDVDAGGRTGGDHRPAVEVSFGARYAERDFRVHDNARFDRAGCAREESAVFD